MNFVRVGLHLPNFVFRDDDNLNTGEPNDLLLDAIKCSKVSIPIISKNYATSGWCLREIFQIMECVKSGKQKVYPVLYKVTPGNVKDITGDFGEAFRRNEHKLDEEVKQKGLVALRELVDCEVIESEKVANGHEGEFVKRLVEEIMSKHQHDFLSLPKNLVGIDDHVAKVMNLADSRTKKSANTASSETQIIVIYGISGIGKTTLATTIYKKLFNQFECHSSLNDIRETIKSKGIKYVQSLHISNLTKRSGHSEHVSGIEAIRRICKKKKVLIFLDDVEHRDHLDNLIGGCNFESGSWIIITCRDKALLKSEYKEYKLEEMNLKDSLLLFGRYAFKGEQPPSELAALSSDIVGTIGGLPLALVIIGSFLKGKDQSVWTETKVKLRKVPHMDVQQKLRISYDSLEYEQQQMFLDIACFFIGINKRFATYLWEDLQYCPNSRLERMIELSLMKIDDNNELRMHDHLRDLGRAIACPANKKPWKCSRLWDEKAVIVQQSKEENKNIEALYLDENGSNMFMKRQSFKRMPYLKFLHLSKVDFVGDFEDSLSELRWLEWKGCPNSFKAINVHLDKLVMLDLSYGNISENWGGWSSIMMERLKVLNLVRCIHLKTTPNFSAFKSLEILILEDCNLKEIDSSIGDVKCLISLNLSDCWNLTKLPSQLGNLRNLVSLNLSGCEQLQKLPKEMSQLEELKELIINVVCIKEIPPWISSLKKLEILSAKACDSLVGLPNSIGHLVNLSTLDLRYCSHFEGFPDSIGDLVKLQRLLLGDVYSSSQEHGDLDCHWYWVENYHLNHIPHSIGKLKFLTELRLTSTKISELPESIGNLESLKILNIAGCTELSSLPNTISKLGNLEELDASACKSLGGEVFINGLSSLKILRLGKLSYINDIQGMRDAVTDCLDSVTSPSSRQHLDLTNRDLPANLSILEVTCRNRTLPRLYHLIHLKELNIQFCKFLESIPILPSGILKLCVSLCCKLKELPSLSSLKLLSKLSIQGCSELIEMPSLSSLKLLSKLSIQGCSELIEIKGLQGLKSLGDLSIGGCNKLSNYNGLGHLESLRMLDITELDAPFMNDDLFQVQCLGRLKNLNTLGINSCQSLEGLDISQLTHLMSLGVYYCKNLVVIKCLGRLKNLKTLLIWGCDSIETLPHLSLFDNLNCVSLRECPKLGEVEGLKKVKDVSRS